MKIKTKIEKRNYVKNLFRKDNIKIIRVSHKYLQYISLVKIGIQMLYKNSVVFKGRI